MKKMKKLLAALLALMMVFALCACGGNSGADNKYGTITPGVLTVVTSPDYAPYEFYALDDSGRVHHEKCRAGGSTSWNQDFWEKYQ